MGNIERSGWDYEGRVVEAMTEMDQTIARFCKALGEPIPEDAIRRAEQLAGAVGERDALRMTLHNVGAWLSSGNFAGWEMVVSEIEATLNHPGGQ